MQDPDNASSYHAMADTKPSLLSLKEKINEEKMGKAAFLMIITGGQYAFQRKDGIWIVPIGCLKD
jgi:hypothetical protein